MMDESEVKEKLLELMSSSRYMPMRKRSLARELDISDEDYRDFRVLLDELVKQNVIDELKRGKFGLPRADDRARTATLNFGIGKRRDESKFGPPAPKSRDDDGDRDQEGDNDGGSAK